jgi:predicted nucleotidyltransferase
MEWEIRSILQKLPEIQGVYGFGSFFRGQFFNDIDLLFVLRCNDEALLAASKEIRFLISDTSRKLGVTLHPLILTEREIEESPLRDMHELTPLS